MVKNGLLLMSDFHSDSDITRSGKPAGSIQYLGQLHFKTSACGDNMAMICHDWGKKTDVPPGVQKIPTCGALLHGEGQGAGGLSQRRPDRMWKWRNFSPRQIVSSESIYDRDFVEILDVHLESLGWFWHIFNNIKDSILRILRVMPGHAWPCLAGGLGAFKSR